MTIVNDILADRLSRLAIAYGRHVVKGFTTKHVNDASGPTATWQQALGQASFYDSIAGAFRCGGWDSVEKLYYQGFEIDAANYHFHSGGAADAPDALFPGDIAHPMASYYSAQLTGALAAQIARDDITPDQMIGIFKTLKVADYNEDGDQIDDDGDPLPGGSNPDNFLYYSASPAREIMDLRRRARRSLLHVNYPSYVAWREYCAEEIDWDDGALTPHQISLQASAGGSLAPGTYWVRVATLKSGDISSASHDRATDGVSTASVVISGGNLRFTVTWASQEDRGATGYRIYIGTAEGAQDRYFVVGSGATNTLLVTTLTGATMGAPPELATGALLRQVPRFESHVFFPPPFDLSTAMDRIAQITCMDWQYANGKLVFLTPEVREPVFTLNLSEATNFKTYQVDRRNKPNQIIVNYRNLDDPYLSQADPPVTVDRPALQAKEGVRPFEINGGCMYRSQAERVGHYWARRLIDSDQMLEIFGSPRTYIVLPGDPIAITHDVPNWTDVEFYVEEKEEQEDTKAGYQMTARVYGEWYSDTDSSPLPRPLPSVNPSAFAAPPIVASVTLTQRDAITADGLITSLHGAVQFADYVGQQRGRVWWKRPGEGSYEATQTVLVPDASTLQAAFEFRAVPAGTYKIKVVTESELGVSLAFGDHTEYSITIIAPDGEEPEDFTGFYYEGSGDLLLEWAGDPVPAAPTLEIYDLEFRNDADNATLRAVEIRPALNRELSEAIGFKVIDDGGNTVVLEDGGFSIFLFNNNSVELESVATAEVVGGFLFEHAVKDGMLVPHEVKLVPLSGGDTFGWYRSPQLPGQTTFTYGADDYELPPGYGIVPGDRFYMRVRADGVLEYGLNYRGEGSVPLKISPNRVNQASLYKIAVSYQLIPTIESECGLTAARWVRQGPEFLYTAAMQRADRGLDESDPLPDPIKARVRQRSAYAGGVASPWVDGVFAR